MCSEHWLVVPVDHQVSFIAAVMPETGVLHDTGPPILGLGMASLTSEKSMNRASIPQTSHSKEQRNYNFERVYIYIAGGRRSPFPLGGCLWGPGRHRSSGRPAYPSQVQSNLTKPSIKLAPSKFKNLNEQSRPLTQGKWPTALHHLSPGWASCLVRKGCTTWTKG